MMHERSDDEGRPDPIIWLVMGVVVAIALTGGLLFFGA
jgi:hypothetical protein